ncbi:DUF711 family protein [Bacteroidota bacterium]
MKLSEDEIRKITLFVINDLGENATPELVRQAVAKAVGKLELEIKPDLDSNSLKIILSLGINLRDCPDRNIDVVKYKIQRKILHYGKNHVEYVKEIESKYGNIVAGNILSLTPISIPFDNFSKNDFIEIAEVLDLTAEETGFAFISGYSVLIQSGITRGELEFIKSIPEAMSRTKRVHSSINVASKNEGINSDAVNIAAEVIKRTAEMTSDNDSIGCSKLAVICNFKENHPFAAGAFHGVHEGDVSVNVGINTFDFLRGRFDDMVNTEENKLTDVVRNTFNDIAASVELVGKEVALKHGAAFGGVADLHALLSDQDRQTGLMDDSPIIQKVVAVPGNTDVSAIAGMISAECESAIKRDKALTLRIIPVTGKKEGEFVDYGMNIGKIGVIDINKFVGGHQTG